MAQGLPEPGVIADGRSPVVNKALELPLAVGLAVGQQKAAGVRQDQAEDIFSSVADEFQAGQQAQLSELGSLRQRQADLRESDPLNSAAMRETQARIKRLITGQNQGVMTPQAARLKLDTASRELQRKYPTYSTLIRQTISESYGGGSTGVFQDALQAERDLYYKQQDIIQKKMLEAGIEDPSDPYAQAEFMAVVRQDEEIERAKEALAYDTAQWNNLAARVNTSELVKNAPSRELDQRAKDLANQNAIRDIYISQNKERINIALDGVSRQATQSYFTIESKYARELETGVGLSEDKIAGAVGEIYAAHRAALTALSSKELNPGGVDVTARVQALTTLRDDLIKRVRDGSISNVNNARATQKMSQVERVMSNDPLIMASLVLGGNNRIEAATLLGRNLQLPETSPVHQITKRVLDITSQSISGNSKSPPITAEGSPEIPSLTRTDAAIALTTEGAAKNPRAKEALRNYMLSVGHDELSALQVSAIKDNADLWNQRASNDKNALATQLIEWKSNGGRVLYNPALRAVAMVSPEGYVISTAYSKTGGKEPWAGQNQAVRGPGNSGLFEWLKKETGQDLNEFSGYNSKVSKELGNSVYSAYRDMLNQKQAENLLWLFERDKIVPGVLSPENTAAGFLKMYNTTEDTLEEDQGE